MTAYYSFLGLILQGVLVNLLFAFTSAEGQNLRDVKVSVNVVNVSLEQALQIIESKTQFKFIFFEEGLPLKEKATVIVDDESLYNILEVFAKDYGLTFNRINDQIVVKKNQGQTENLVTAVETGTIKGKVTDVKTGEGLIGASVTIKGTKRGSSTDLNGNYTIDNVNPGKYALVATNVGYASKEETVIVSAEKTSSINFALNTSLVNFDEVTVTGTLSAREIRSYPATVAEIKGVELQNRNINNIANVLEAIPGIIISPGSEGLNSGSTRLPLGLLIRGTSVGSIKYLVDGIDIVSYSGTQNILQTLDPNDIEKIEVLKGPMASTLYGNGGAGGIISITTKKGKEGKTHINFRTMFTQYANDYADYNGYNQNYSLNISGGGEQFNYLLGVGYNLYPTTKLTDINNGIEDKTWSYTAKIRGKLSNISADLSLQYGNEYKGVGSTTPSSNKYRVSLGLSPLTVSPLSDSRYSQRSFLTTLHLTHTVADNWYHDLTIGYNIMNQVINYYTKSGLSTYNNFELLLSKMNVRYFMFYDQPWSENLKSSITTGFEYNGYEMHLLSISSTTPLTDFFTSFTPATANSASFTKSPYSSTGYFAEVVTGLNNNLFLTTGIRFDVNNAYGDNVGAYPQPRVGLSYVVQSGDFNIKPRVVWGVSSNAPDPTYKTTYNQTYSDGNYIFVGNPDIKPQRSEGYELGADIFYGSDYALNITYYDQKIKDMILNSQTIDLTTNPITYYLYNYNIAEAINRGLEVSAKAVINPFVVDLSYTETISKWGNEIGQAPTSTVYPQAPSFNVPQRSFFARLTYSIPSFLSWTEKGGRISVDWRYNGSAYYYDAISYNLNRAAWQKLPTPRPAAPNLNNYYLWQKGYSYFNLRMDYSVTDYAAFYVDIQNLLNKHGSINGQSLSQFPGRRINVGFNITY